MCGIAGVWGPSPEGAVEMMVAAMRHRGPDDSGVYRDERLALGSTRLAIVDITSAGHQPMANPDGTVW
ncbi:MAG: asparagine synthase (glutamine-hydrolyzing), partial [Gaiellaceae bacterium]